MQLTTLGVGKRFMLLSLNQFKQIEVTWQTLLVGYKPGLSTKH
jgi:hypothetical protein